MRLERLEAQIWTPCAAFGRLLGGPAQLPPTARPGPLEAQSCTPCAAFGRLLGGLPQLTPTRAL